MDENPFWLAKIGESQNGIGNCFMVWFDVREMVFKKASVPSSGIENGNHRPLVDQKKSVLVFGEYKSGWPVRVEN